MKILITGGAGYKGVLLTESLLNLGYDVTIMDNFMYGYDSITHLLKFPNLNVIKLDIRNLNEKNLKNYDCIFHLAGISGMPACNNNPHSANSINLESVKNILNFLSPNQYLINASTTSMYGYSKEICNEDSEVKPVSVYGITKYESEKIIQDRNNSISLRFATVFGVSPKMRHDLMVNDFVYKAINDRNLILFAGNIKRTFIHVNDAVNSYLFTLENFENMKNNVYNVGDESMNLSKLDIAKSIKQYIDFEIIDSTLPELDKRDFEIDFSKIKKLGYSTKYNLDFGINELIKLYSFYTQYLPYKII
jgi:nucleoside-diphosphate-sugar epimerase